MSSRARMFSSVPYLVSPGDLAWAQVKAKADLPGQIQHRLVLHHLAGGHQDAQDDPLLAAIHHDSASGSPGVCHRL